jgi:hypothetical protein
MLLHAIKTSFTAGCKRKLTSTTLVEFSHADIAVTSAIGCWSAESITALTVFVTIAAIAIQTCIKQAALRSNLRKQSGATGEHIASPALICNVRCSALRRQALCIVVILLDAV